MAAIAVATFAMPVAHASEPLGDCGRDLGGVDARTSCTYVAVPNTGAHLYLLVRSGYGFAVLTCNGIQRVNTGVQPAGDYHYPFLQTGGLCVLEIGVNGDMYAWSN